MGGGLDKEENTNAEFENDLNSTYSWIIKPGTILEGKSLESPEFNTGTKKEFTWKLIFLKTMDFEKVYLKLIKSIETEILVDCIMEYNTFYGDYSTYSGTKAKPTRLSLASMHFHTDSVEKLFESKLTSRKGPYKFTIEIKAKSKITNLAHQMEEKLTKSTNLYADHFESLFLSHQFSDVIFSISGQTLHAHKNILSARSKVFMDEFCKNRQDTKDSIIIVDRVECKHFIEMLRFIYCGKIREIENKAEYLLSLAGEYALDDLKATCALYLYENLTAANSIETLKIAKFNEAHELKELVIEFIFKNKDNEVIKKDVDALKDSHAALAIDILKKFNSSL